VLKQKKIEAVIEELARLQGHVVLPPWVTLVVAIQPALRRLCAEYQRNVRCMKDDDAA
jgi:hypothetical protein